MITLPNVKRKEGISPFLYIIHNSDSNTMRLPQIIHGVLSNNKIITPPFNGFIISSLLVGLFLIPMTGFGQKGLLEKANKQYELHNFKEAITTYQRYIKTDRNNVSAKGKLANSLRLLGRQKEALRWYREINFAGKDYPEFQFQNALLLKELGDYQGARKLFLSYAEKYPDKGIHFAESCTIAIAKQSSPSTYEIVQEYISSDAADFGPAFFGDGVVYSSSRIDYSEKDKQRDNLNQLFISNIDFNGNLGNPQVFHERFKGFNEGPISYSPDGKWVAITKNNYIDGVRQVPDAGLNLNIFIAEVLPNGEWEREVFFPFNGTSFSTGFPSFSPDGNALYFASDRPDGFGGFDLFVCYRSGNTWTTPENLGPTVNSEGNEITPFFNGADLFFASDWHQGMGGLDVFRASSNGTFWDKVYNLDTQINSPKDDYGFIFDNGRNIGYLVSNRDGGKGKEDIYKVTRNNNYAGNNNGGNYNGQNNGGNYNGQNNGGNYNGQNNGGNYNGQNNGGNYNGQNNGGNYNGNSYPTTARSLPIVVLDEFSMRPVPNAEIDMTPCNQQRYYTDNTGRVTLNIPAGLNCEVYVRQNGYITGLLRVSGNSLQGVQSQQILLRSGTSTPPVVNNPPVTNNPPVVTTPNGNLILGRVYDQANNSGIEGVYVKAVNQSTGTILETTTAVTGEYNLTLRPNSTYLITYSLGGFRGTTKSVTAGNFVDANLLGSTTMQYVGGSSTATNAPPTVITETAKGSGSSVSTGSARAGYSVQVGAYNATDKVDFNKFRDLGSYGNVYNRYEGNTTKVRVGVFPTRAEAKAAVASIKSKGYRDAFVTTELKDGLGDGIMLDGSNVGTAVTTSSTSVPSTPPSTSSAGTYKVRLASYRNPRFFNPAKVTGLGTIEQQVKAPWTIMLLTGFPNLSEAIFAKNNAVKAGFRQAHVVLDNGIELKKVKF